MPSKSLINLVYLRHPNDILISKMKRFFSKNDTNKFEKEIQKIISFYKYNRCTKNNWCRRTY